LKGIWGGGVLSLASGCAAAQVSVQATDSRVSYTSEAIRAIKVVKYNGWVGSFLANLAALRRAEEASLARAAW
jgi:hypothetical protein